MQLDFDNLPATRSEIENIINDLGQEETLELVNAGRKRMLDPDHKPTEMELTAGIMLVRRLRGLRETRTRVSKAKAAPAGKPALSLDDLL